MKVLITGAAGFIGFHLAKILASAASDGDQIIGVDNLNKYYDINLKLARLEELGILRDEASSEFASQSKHYPSLLFVNIDLRSQTDVNELFTKYKFDAVVHLAAQPGVRYSVENPGAYVDNNINAFIILLEAIKNAGIKHFIYASSSSVYGRSEENILSTEQRTDAPVSIYAATKKANELMANVYSDMYNINTIGLRFFTVYGPWGRPDMAIFLFTKEIFSGGTIKVYNDGLMERDFTYVDDIVNVIAKIIEKEVHSKRSLPAETANNKAVAKVYNIGNNNPVKLGEFIRLLETEIGKDVKKQFLPLQKGDVLKTYADIGPLTSDYGYKPSTPIAVGIRNFVTWYKKHYKC